MKAFGIRLIDAPGFPGSVSRDLCIARWHIYQRQYDLCEVMMKLISAVIFKLIHSVPAKSFTAEIFTFL
jgi:hypothetical protein